MVEMFSIKVVGNDNETWELDPPAMNWTQWHDEGDYQANFADLRDKALAALEPRLALVSKLKALQAKPEEARTDEFWSRFADVECAVSDFDRSIIQCALRVIAMHGGLSVWMPMRRIVINLHPDKPAEIRLAD
jgi:hypothetical protein